MVLPIISVLIGISLMYYIRQKTLGDGWCCDTGDTRYHLLPYREGNETRTHTT